MNKELLFSEAGIGFIGAFIGGILALIGAIVTIVYYRRKDRQDKLREDNRNISGFYYLLLSKANLLGNWLEPAYSDTFVVQVTPIYTSEENMFLFNRLQSVLKVTSDSSIRELLAFMSDLQQLENARSECLTELQLRGTVKKSDQDNYIRILTHCNKKLIVDKEKELAGIINILDSLEQYTKKV